MQFDRLPDHVICDEIIMYLTTTDIVQILDIFRVHMNMTIIEMACRQLILRDLSDHLERFRSDMKHGNDIIFFSILCVFSTMERTIKTFDPTETRLQKICNFFQDIYNESCWTQWQTTTKHARCWQKTTILYQSFQQNYMP